jgi:hypothetical protein
LHTGQTPQKLVVVAIVFAVIAVAYAATAPYVALHYGGTIRGIGVGIYKDVGCTQPLNSVDTGSMSPGAVTNTTAYIRNEGDQPITLLLQTSNWNPSNASDYITLTWNYNGLPVGVNNVIHLVLSLYVSPAIEGIPTFSFDAIITKAA